jgi:hypothetical protein
MQAAPGGAQPRADMAAEKPGAASQQHDGIGQRFHAVVPQ